MSFPIACGSCENCQKDRFSQCQRTNENTIENAMYGKRTAGTSESNGYGAWDPCMHADSTD